MKQRAAAMNTIWLWLLVLAILTGMATGSMEDLTRTSFDSAKNAVTLALSLIGAMALWLGLMKIAEAGGLMRLIARGIRPVMVRLFPEVPAEHPAMAAMIMNIAANMLGLGNAATPLGIKAMMELDKLNAEKGRATNAMCLFLAINTSNVTILPLGVIGVRAAAGSNDPAAIIIPSILATSFSTLTAIVVAKLLAPKVASSLSVTCSEQTAEVTTLSDEEKELTPPGTIGKSLLGLALLGAVGLFFYRLFTDASGAFGNEVMQYWVIPVLMLAILAFGAWRGVKVYETATAGAKEGFEVAIRILPFLVMIFVAIGMFKASGAFAIFADFLSPATSFLGIPVDTVPMILMRPLSGSGAFGVLTELTNQDPNGFSAFLAGIMQGSTETTFYVLTVYFGAVGVTKIRHALWAALIADLAGMTASVVLAHLWYS